MACGGVLGGRRQVYPSRAGERVQRERPGDWHLPGDLGTLMVPATEATNRLVRLCDCC